MNKHHRIAPIILIALGIPIALIVGFLMVANILFHDEKPPDDSALRLNDVSIPDNQNAYFAVQQLDADVLAANPNITEPLTDTKVDEMLAGGTWDANYATEVLRKYSTAIKDLHTATDNERYQDPSTAHPDSIDPNVFPEHIDHLRFVAKLAALGAMNQARSGDATNALTNTFDIVRLGQEMESGQNTLIEWLIGSGLKQIGFSAYRQIAKQTVLTADQAKTTAQTLEAYRGQTGDFAQAMKLEYAYQLANRTQHPRLSQMIDQYNYTGSSDPSQTSRFVALLEAAGVTRFYYWPNQTLRFTIESKEQLLSAAQADCATGNLYPSLPPPQSHHSGVGRLIEPNTIGKLLADIGRISYGGISTKICNESLAVSATQISLAASAYLHDTKGWPPKLEDLVPKYLSAVPLDPYSGQAFHYDNSTGTFYSVGPKRVDVGGSPVSEDWQKQDNPSFSIRPKN